MPRFNATHCQLCEHYAAGSDPKPAVTRIANVRLCQHHYALLDAIAREDGITIDVSLKSA